MGITFTRTLHDGHPLSLEDRTAVDAIVGEEENVERHQRLVREGDDPGFGFLLIEGWAFRYRMLPDGKRRIVGFLLPGDICNVHVFDPGLMDHGIEMLSQGKVVRILHKAIRAIADERPDVRRAIWRSRLTDEAVLREWLVNISGRDACARIAHLLCELYARMEHVGLVNDASFDLRLTQIHLAEALGLTSVHVNRMLRRLRLQGLITHRSQRLTIHDIGKLKLTGGFDPGYLFARSQL